MKISSIAYLSWKYLSYRPLKTLALIAAVALTIYLPFALQAFINESTRILQERARSTPLLIGAKGSSIDLALNSLYFTEQALPSVEYGAFERLEESNLGRAIPLHARFEASGAPILGSTLDYFEFRGLSVAEGRMFTRLGDCVLGASVAKSLGLGPGDKIVSSPENVFDLAGVYPLKMRITGVLATAHTADDDAVFIDLKTAWTIEGLAHGHQDLTTPGASDAVLSRDGNTIRANASVLEFMEVTDENVDTFHFHGDRSNYPISSIIAVPDSEKSRAITLGRYQSDAATEQIIVPFEAVTKLTNTLFATRKMVLGAFVLLGVTALGLAALVFVLSFRLREKEMRTYAKIGATDFTIRTLKFAEVAAVLVIGAAIAAVAVIGTQSLASQILPTLLG